MNMDKAQPPASHIHPLPNDIPPLILPIPSQQSIETTPPIPIPHSEGTSNIVARPSPLQGRPSHSVSDQTTNSNSKVTLVHLVAQHAPTINPPPPLA